MATAFKEFGKPGATTGVASATSGVVGVVLPVGYRPGDDDDYMSPAHLAYFRAKLLGWRESIVQESRLTLSQLQADSLLQPDATDRASSETDWGLELRTRDRQRKLIGKINAALRRIDAGDYGYCDVTGEPISLGVATETCVEQMVCEAARPVFDLRPREATIPEHEAFLVRAGPSDRLMDLGE